MKVQTWGFTSNLCSFEVGKLQIFEWFSIHRIMLSQHMNLNCEQNPSSAEPIHNGNAIWGILHYWDRHGPWTQKLRSRWGEFPSSFFEWLGVFARQQSSGSFLCIWIIWCFPSRFLFLLCDHLPALLAPTFGHELHPHFLQIPLTLAGFQSLGTYIDLWRAIHLKQF